MIENGMVVRCYDERSGRTLSTGVVQDTNNRVPTHFSLDARSNMNWRRDFRSPHSMLGYMRVELLE